MPRAEYFLCEGYGRCGIHDVHQTGPVANTPGNEGGRSRSDAYAIYKHTERIPVASEHDRVPGVIERRPTKKWASHDGPVVPLRLSSGLRRSYSYALFAKLFGLADLLMATAPLDAKSLPPLNRANMVKLALSKLCITAVSLEA